MRVSLYSISISTASFLFIFPHIPKLALIFVLQSDRNSMHIRCSMKCLNEICHFAPPTSTEGTPRSSTQLSPTVNLSSEFTLAVHTNSYSEIWSRIHSFTQDHEQVIQAEIFNENADHHQMLLSQLLQPNRECVEETLRHSKPSNLTPLVSAYFDHSQNTANLCLVLFQSVHRARALYAPIHQLLDVLVLPHDSDSPTQSQCDMAFEVFLQFKHIENPFPRHDSDNNLSEMRSCFSQLKQQLDHMLQKSRSRVRLLHWATAGSAIYLVGIAISAAIVATHALTAAVMVPFCVPCCGVKKRELAHMAQLDAAAKGVYVLNNDLDTIDRLVTRLCNAVEGDKHLIRFGLDRSREMCSSSPINVVLKQLRKNHLNVTEQLKDLEEHICLCLSAVNKARALLLQTIHLHDS